MQMLDEGRAVHRIAMENFQALELIGRVVVVDGCIVAYTFGYEISKTMFCVLFEICDMSMSGLSSYIFSEFCGDKALSQYKLINTMDDMFLDNVKKTKESFLPCLKPISFTITRKDERYK